jgi:glycosyltransferase involved in cell wall biosynthesis
MKQLNRQKIYINGRFLSQPVTGVQRYSRELVTALDALIESSEIDGGRYEFVLLSPRLNSLPGLFLKNISQKTVGRFTGHLWEQLELPYYSRGGLLFCPGNTAPVVSLLFNRSVVVTLHSLAFQYFPEMYSFAFRLLYRVLIPLVLKYAAGVITVSQTEKEAIVKKYPRIKANLVVIQNGGLPAEMESVDLSKITRENSAKSPFILFVGSVSKGKNLRGVIKAVDLLNRKTDCCLVAVGAESKVFQKIDYDISPELEEKILFLGQIEKTEKLIKFYRSAICLVFPSFYEASSLPPIEAMACGCPVVASSIPSLRERCGDAAIYCDPAVPLEIADAVYRIIVDEKLKEDLRKKGLERAASYDWKNCAKKTFQLFKTLFI